MGISSEVLSTNQSKHFVSNPVVDLVSALKLMLGISQNFLFPIVNRGHSTLNIGLATATESRIVFGEQLYLILAECFNRGKRGGFYCGIQSKRNTDYR